MVLYVKKLIYQQPSSFGGKDGEDASSTADIEDNLRESFQVIFPPFNVYLPPKQMFIPHDGLEICACSHFVLVRNQLFYDVRFISREKYMKPTFTNTVHT